MPFTQAESDLDRTSPRFRYSWPKRNFVPDTTDYLARIRDYAQGKDPLELQKQTAAVLAELVAKASDEQLTRRPSKDK